MVYRCEQLRFAFDTGQRVRIAKKRAANDLDRDLPL
jgi:hypothetical protein